VVMMIYIQDLEEIKRMMGLPEDDKNIEPEDLVYKEEKETLRFGGNDE